MSTIDTALRGVSDAFAYSIAFNGRLTTTPAANAIYFVMQCPVLAPAVQQRNMLITGLEGTVSFSGAAAASEQVWECVRFTGVPSGGVALTAVKRNSGHPTSIVALAQASVTGAIAVAGGAVESSLVRIACPRQPGYIPIDFELSPPFQLRPGEGFGLRGLSAGVIGDSVALFLTWWEWPTT